MLPLDPLGILAYYNVNREGTIDHQNGKPLLTLHARRKSLSILRIERSSPLIKACASRQLVAWVKRRIESDIRINSDSPLGNEKRTHIYYRSISSVSLEVSGIVQRLRMRAQFEFVANLEQVPEEMKLCWW